MGLPEHPELVAEYCLFHKANMAWRMVARHDLWAVFILLEGDREIVFGRRIDAELAIEAFRQAGLITREQLIRLPQADRLRIATSLLQW